MGTVHGPIADGFTASTGLSAGWAFELPSSISLVPRIWLGNSESQQAGPGVRAHQISEFGAELAGRYVLDFGPISMAPQVSVGVNWLHQQITFDASSQDSRPVALVSALGGHLSWPFGYGLSVEGLAELATFYLPRQTDTTQTGESALRTGTVTYRVGLGVGYRY